MKRADLKTLSKVLTGTALFSLMVTGGACGKTKFNPTSSDIQATGPGSYTIPAKVDIILAEDDTGSISEAYDQISAQIPGFVASLEQSGWDYHFVNIPLTTDRPITQALASHYDSNWGSQWTPAYPGQSATASGMLPASIFRRPESFSAMISRGDVDYTNSKNATEWGFDNIETAISVEAKAAKVLRSDAMLVIMVISTGQDTSGVTLCARSDSDSTGQVMVPCAGSDAASFNSYYTYFKGLRPSGRVKFYAAVANGEKNCLGNAQTFAGTRYQQMAYNLSGQFYNICQQNVSTVFSSLVNDLAATRISLRTRYLFINKQPQLGSIKVYKNGQLLPESSTNGWTYAGYVNNVYAIDYPTSMNLSTGYAIELHGTAKLVGDDSGSVTFDPYGVQGSSG